MINSLQENTIYLIDEKEALTKKYKSQNETLEKALKVLEQKHESVIKSKAKENEKILKTKNQEYEKALKLLTSTNEIEMKTIKAAHKKEIKDKDTAHVKEIKEKGLQAKAFVEEQFEKHGEDVIVHTIYNRGKYGRTIGDVEFDNGSKLSFMLLKTGNAKESTQ